MTVLRSSERHIPRRNYPTRPFPRPQCVFNPQNGYIIYNYINNTNQKRIFYLPPRESVEFKGKGIQQCGRLIKEKQVSPLSDFEDFVTNLFNM